MKMRVFGQLEIFLGTAICNRMKAQYRDLWWNKALSWRSSRDAHSAVSAQEGQLEPGVGESHTWLKGELGCLQALLPCQDSCGRLSLLSPDPCAFNTTRVPCQISRFLRTKKAKWRFGNAHPGGCRRAKKEQAYCPFVTKSLRLVPPFPQGEQSELDLIFLQEVQLISL